MAPRRTPTKRTATVALVVILFTVPGCDAPVGPQQVSPLRGITAQVTVDANGATRSAFHYRLASAHATTLAVEAPADGNVARVTVDGNPVPVTGRSGVVDADGPDVDVVVDVDGAVRRTGTAATLGLVLWAPSAPSGTADRLVPVDVRVRVPTGAFAVDDRAVETLGVVDPVDRFVGDTVHVRGFVHPGRAATATITVDGAAFDGVTSTASVQAGSRRAERVDAFRQRSDRAFFAAADDARRDRAVWAIAYWSLVALEIIVPLAVVATRATRNAARRRRAGIGVPETRSEPPGGLAPDLVALVDAGGNRIGAASVAATVLDLIVRRRIDLDHVTTATFRIRPAGSPGSTATADPPPLTDAEAVLLDELHRITVDDPDGWADSPVALVRSGTWWRRYRRDVVRRARAQHLIRHRFPPTLFVLSVVALAVTSAPLWGHDPDRAAVVVVVAMGLIALAAFGGFELTDAGLTTRARWRAFGRYAEANLSLPEASVPAVEVWGDHLVAACALGIARPAIDASSCAPRSDRGSTP